nr:PQQ-binding-like beta-propeller repeat protein [uncultured Actinoplanes sp.]
MTLIELGEATWPEEEHLQRPRPPIGRRQIRKVAVAVVAGLCLAGLTASQRPAPPRVQTLWSAPSWPEFGMVVAAGTAFTQQTDPGGIRITAFALDSGEQRWSRVVGDAAGFLQAAEPAGLLLASADRQVAALVPGAAEPLAPEFSRQTIALDMRTGEERWRAPGEVQAIEARTATMTEYRDDGTPRRLRVIRLADDHVMWSIDATDIDAHTVAHTGDQPTAFITVKTDGTATVHRYADGTRLVTGHIPWTRPKREGGYFNDLFAIGGRLIAYAHQPDRSITEAYDLATLRMVWGLEAADGYVTPCGTGVCFQGGATVMAHDAATGKPLWTLPVTANVWPISDDRIVLYEGDSDTDHLSVIDARTGATLGERPTGSMVWTDRPGTAMLLTRAVGSPPDRTVLTRWDTRTGRQDVLGLIDHLTGSGCQSAPGYVICQIGTKIEVTVVR